MRYLQVVVMILLIAGISSVASAEIFSEDFESYANGSALHGQGGWKGWNNDSSAGAPVSSLYSYSGSNSVEVVGSADLVHEFDHAEGRWELSIMQYIPSGTKGNSWFILLNTYNDNGAQDWSVQLVFDLGTGEITSDYDNGTLANIVYDKWVEIKCVIDLDNNSVDEYYNGVLISTHRWDDSNNKTIGCIDLYGDGADSIYYDDLIISPPIIAYNPNPSDNAVHSDTWVSMSWGPGAFASSQDVYFSDNLDDVETGAESAFIGNQAEKVLVAGFPGFPFPDGLVPGTSYYWRIDEVNDLHPESPWIGDVWSFLVPPRTAFAPEPADAGEAVAVKPSFSWTPGFGAKLHTVYFGDNFDEVSNAAGGLPQGIATYSPGELKQAKTYYWRVDEFDAVETFKGEVWSFTTEGAVLALNPANGAVDVSQTPTLTWTPGFGASHEIYFGADAASLELKGSGNIGSESYDPGQLEWNTTYYWRVDEANSANADSPWTGPLWSLTTANFLIIDDMESYNDLNEDEPASNRIYLAWIDGFDSPATNGSVVGNLNPPFAEQSIVHSGNQSMPISYDNAVGKSEVTSALTSNSDWTVNGVTTLTIWYRGAPTNAPELMYVALNGSAVITNDNPDAAQKSSWTEWNIDLQAFADQGVSLANITSITLGLGNRANPVAGGTGMMYFDDIRLYPPAP
ncbi:MAG: hypothetical protein GY845_04640 [Planctomycetes bacterium]|nr:hypothetical protein [Planctomycetota bacterium]